MGTTTQNRTFRSNRFIFFDTFGSPFFYPYGYYDYNYPYAYSYYNEPAYGYDASLVAQVQRRLAEMGYYHGVIDGIMGPQTRAAISAYEGTHHLVMDGMINPQLLARMGLG